MTAIDADRPNDRAERFMALLGQSQLKIQAYVTTMAPKFSDADEILQNTNLALWRRFDDFREGTSFLAWARSVALIEIKRFRQARNQDRLSFSNEVLDLIDATVDRDSDRLIAERDALNVCMGRLPAADRDLVGRVYHGGERIVDISADQDASVSATYVKLHRIRRRLLDCITTRLEHEGWS